MNKHAALSLLVIDECLLDEPDESTRSLLLELLKRRYDRPSTMFEPNTPDGIGTSASAPGVYADAIMDRIVHDTIWVETGGHNMREHTAGQVTA